MRRFLLLAAVLGVAGAARAEVGAKPMVTRDDGVVTAISDTSITLAEPAGGAHTIPLLPTWGVSVSKPIKPADIQPGSYLGTTNYAKPDGTGRSTEVHVSPPGRSGPGLDFVMDAAAGTTMTNGVVATVAMSEGGRVLAINYGPGVRRVTVPDNVPVVLNTPGERSLVSVGRTVRVTSFTPAGGGATRQFITVGENGAAPPP